MQSYEDEYHLKRHGRFLSDQDFFRFNAFVAERKFWHYLCDNVLEVGCGIGFNIVAHPDAIGVDISTYALLAARERGVKRVALMDAENLGFLAGMFDGVLCVHVLEHLPQPLVALQEFHRVLRPEGKLVVEIPLKRRRSSPIDQHLYVWGRQEIINLLNKAGFKVNNVDTVSFRLKKVLCHLPIPINVALTLSLVGGKLALLIGIRQGPGEIIAYAQKR